MADSGNMSLSRSSEDQNRDDSSDDRFPFDQAKTTNMERQVISAARNRTYLPPDIVEEILALLPFKSIERFRSVSKSLFTLLATPKLLYCPRGSITKFPPYSYYGIKRSDDESLFTGVVLSDYRDDAKNRGYMVPEFSCREGYYNFVGTCNGLVCLVFYSTDYSKWETVWYEKKRETFVWNPFTGLCRKLPNRNYYYAYGFGYDSASDDYKVFLAGADGEVEIFSLKTGSLKKVKNPDGEYLRDILTLTRAMGLFLNGALHWAWGIAIIIAFDLDKEKFYRVPNPPNEISPDHDGYYSVGVVGEYLCMCATIRQKYIVWVMKEYCDKASWVPFISYTPSSQYGKEYQVEYVCDFIPRSFKDGRYMMLQFA
ncbi:hypothetical protein Tsubulata_043601 [Turnera subulata]|uniref:F-box domain-containing protein n=1 Tax=Turnera subulata TaxID=218843 RepID=A0A9Q0FR51_9ROSI|nr:hypothetical protein Tsubulata_043601 [Turnera subulata]